jgi:hypothetical protein
MVQSNLSPALRFHRLTKDIICGQIVQKFSLVVSHVEKHKQDNEKPNSLLDRVYEEWRGK